MRLPVRATGIPLLVGLLVVTFAIAADLGHEAWRNAVSQQVTAERAGRDVVRFTAGSSAYSAEATMSAGLRALFAPVLERGATGRRVTAPAPDVLVRSARRLRDCRCAPLIPARYYFRVHLRDGALQLAGDSSSPTNERRWLVDTVTAHERFARQPEWEDALIVSAVGARRVVVGYTVRGDSSDAFAYGLVSDIDSFGDVVFASPPRGSTANAPQSSSAGSYDSLTSTLLIAPNGQAIYDAHPRRRELRVTMVPGAGHETYRPGVAPVESRTLFADTVALGPRYGNLRIAVALASEDPGVLVVPGVPRSRFFALFGILVLMAGLVAVAVLQLRREHELARLRADLTAGVSHELRTPLAQILLFGETLMLERTRSERERRAAAEVIVREARRLMHLVENALHFTRADRSLLELTPEPIDLGALTREILVSFAPLAWTARVTLRELIEEPASAFIDADAYRQIMLNLLENAVRYGPVGQTIVVHVERAEGVAQLIVEDEGPGVPNADRERIWTPFVRLTSTRRGAGGTGIGLAVVRDLTLRHGGRAWVERARTGGARFVVELPSGRPATRKGLGQRAMSDGSRATL